MRVIIACAGSQAKWGGHLGVPSHLVPDRDGVPILHRTVAQALEHIQDVLIVAPAGDDRYQVSGAVTYGVAAAPSEYASTRPWWSETDRTVLLLGDVWVSAAAIATILRCADRDFRAFGRFRASRHTGCGHGEIFAASWWPEQHKALDRHLAAVHAARDAGTITRPPGWMLLRAVQGTPMGRHMVLSPWWVEIDDWTDDLDRPVDYDRHPAFGGGDRAGR